MTLHRVPFIQTSTLAQCELVVWGIGILDLLLSIASSQFHSFTKPNSIMKITASSLAILLLSLSASAAAAMSTLPDGGQRHQPVASLYNSFQHSRWRHANAPRCHGGRTIHQRLVLDGIRGPWRYSATNVSKLHHW
jgi:hypothetical protein